MYSNVCVMIYAAIIYSYYVPIFVAKAVRVIETMAIASLSEPLFILLASSVIIINIIIIIIVGVGVVVVVAFLVSLN